MSQNTKRVEYENIIKNSSNYNFMPEDVKKKWVSVSKKGVNPRTEFWTNKLNELILNQTLPVGSRLINLARYLHPTKKHVCKICGDACSIYYVYPSKNTWKWLNKSFDVEKTHENKSRANNENSKNSENRQNVQKDSGNVRRDNNSDSHKVKEVDGNRLDLPNDGQEK